MGENLKQVHQWISLEQLRTTIDEIKFTPFAQIVINGFLNENK